MGKQNLPEPCFWNKVDVSGSVSYNVVLLLTDITADLD